MKQWICLFAAASLLLVLGGCGGEAQPSEPAAQPLPQPSAQAAELRVSDLQDFLSDLDSSGGTLTFCGETEDTRPADAAIRASDYLKELQGYTWETCQIPAEWDGKDCFRCAFTCGDSSLTSYQGGYQNNWPLHMVTESGEGWFTLSTTDAEPNSPAAQYKWMLFDTFERWYQESCAADLYRGDGTPLTVEELTWFESYTDSETSFYDEQWGGFVGSATAISCFFTSKYSDPRDMNASEFLQYCPSQGELTMEDEAEFQLIQKKLDWRVGEDSHLASIAELPCPCHRLPRTYINNILTQYVGITVEEMHTDWREESFYLPETDCFYSFTSDFGPGAFVPCYGERKGDMVTLWEAPNEYDENTTDVLTLQKSGEQWHILSHQAVM